jgi:hypothetical protein
MTDLTTLTTLTTLQSLRDRVAKATGPDREIDRNIAVAFNVFQERFGTLYHWCEAGSTVNPVYNSQLPQYTSSIDAALAWVELVLPGWVLAVCSRAAPSSDLPYARLFTPDMKHQSDQSAPTAPLAIILAGLDALIAKEKTDV